MRKLDDEIKSLIQDSEPRLLRVGTLEGFIPLASRVCRGVMAQSGIETLELNVYDLNVLEEFFHKGDLDLIFTSREPGKRKFNYIENLGFQTLEMREGKSRIHILSQFEAGLSRKIKREKGQKIVISNSLALRREWISRYSANGQLPSEVVNRKGREGKTKPVLMIGADLLSQKLWKQAKAEI